MTASMYDSLRHSMHSSEEGHGLHGSGGGGGGGGAGYYPPDEGAGQGSGLMGQSSGSFVANNEHIKQSAMVDSGTF
eukprot:CAMPEP_0170397516 /NCGR_PEP_ID=MMETSP0117_2-20130122/22915_1 /TAXON_ID=400756 /ORGANISM="Durinskia baltica, Strain CSIRO CS-38" /LENGTH=75 /DNA_ID=CAMNT_0010654021 /DNA_START=513 /DNA_END=740 /DNA_ORIENTATION=-